VQAPQNRRLRFTEVEAALADLVRLLEPLPATNRGPGTGSAAPTSPAGFTMPDYTENK